MADKKSLSLPNGRQRIAAKLKSLFPNSCAKILLVNPLYVSEEDYDIEVALGNRYPVYPPYGLGLLSRDLRDRGYSVDIIDLNYDLQKILKDDKDAFEYRIWENLLRDKIELFDPDLIGLTCMFTITYRQMARIANFIKGIDSSIPVIPGCVEKPKPESAC